MADYDHSAAQSTESSNETAGSKPHTLPTSCETIWESWTQTSPGTTCTLTEHLQQYGSGNNGTKNANLYQPDLLSSWLLPAYQRASHNQSQEFQEEDTGVTMYRDEFSGMNVCNSSSANEHHGAGGWCSSDVSNQLFGPSSSTSVQTDRNSPTEVGEPSRFLSIPPPSSLGTVENLRSECNTSRIDVPNAEEQVLHHINVTELSSRASSSSPPAAVSSYGQIMHHLVAPFNSNSCWPNSVRNISSSCEEAIHNSGTVASSGLQVDHSKAPSDSVLLRHELHNKEESEIEVVYPNTVRDVCDQIHLYEELHGLLSKTLEAPSNGNSSCREEMGACSSNPSTVISSSAGNYMDQSPWTQFAIVPSGTAGTSQSGLMDLQEVNQNIFDTVNTSNTQENLSSTTKKVDDSSISSERLGVSAMHNVGAAISSGPVLRQGSMDSDGTEGLQRKRLATALNSQQMESGGFKMEDSAKRTSIVRCVWEQNIAQLQLANSSSEDQRNLWQLQSQTLFGKVPSGSLLGSSSNSGSLDMPTAVGPALNTNGRPRARRGSATDPQSVYARHRRERIKGRLKVLQHLVPNGAKVDIVTMLEEAINYVKFLQLQVRLLSSDELWIYAPTTYNGIDVSMGMHAGLLNPQS